ncbi:MAG: hypothetical protein ACTSYM_03745 [Candidatus Baldrarchaeia archaeon]
MKKREKTALTLMLFIMLIGIISSSVRLTFSIPRIIFFASIIGIGVPVAGIAGFYMYRYLRIPKVLRTLNKIISKVEKGERVPLDVIANVRSRRDVVNEKVNKLWRNLGIKFGGAREGGKESG